jgi:hypothetical protein
MLRRFYWFALFICMTGCVEPYQFIVHDDAPSLVVEGFISDRSFAETISYPSDGRFFSVKLAMTGDVTNRRANPVTGATVDLISSSGGRWTYSEAGEGLYHLLDANFKAQDATQYKLRIALQDESVFESGWEALPNVSPPPIGAVGFIETEKQMFVMESGKWVIRSFQGAKTHINVPENNTGNPIYYRWIYSPTWLYIAPLSSVVDPGHKCWATDRYYLNTYSLQRDVAGGYAKDLFFFKTIRNERIFEKFSVLLTQHAMTSDYYNFWKEMQDQNEGTAMLDTPPYNLKTNFLSTSGAKRVSGYFGVVREQATRWYFTKNELSYTVENTLRADCLVAYGGPPAAECLDCRAYSFGVTTTTKPPWWQ